jgi:hypothetical protein
MEQLLSLASVVLLGLAGRVEFVDEAAAVDG